MTPAVKLLNKHKVAYALHQYQHDVNCSSYGDEAAQQLKVAPDTVFKTLVIEVDEQYLSVAIIPVTKTLSLKKCAQILRAKKVKMAPIAKVQASTGYVLGGVSPLGQKKRLKTLIADQAEALSNIYISGGKRGLEIAIAPNTLSHLLDAHFHPLTAD